MECRPNCAACCIAISISPSMPALPEGKPAGMPCPHLDEQLRCQLFEHPDRPKTCLRFKAEIDFCGSSKEEAMSILGELEDES